MEQAAGSVGTRPGETEPAGARHVPVLLERVVELCAPALQHPGAVHVDCTLGLGGHAEAILERCPQARVIGIDRDPEALAHSRERLGRFGDRVTFVPAVYSEIGDVLADLGIDHVSSVLADLGLSSLQIDAVDRGFAYRVDAPLDMRMGSDGPTAADVLNTYTAADLRRVLSTHGEERHADRIARAIVRERDAEPFDTSERLVATIIEALPAAVRHAPTGGHPAKRTFQALRIEVNGELDALCTMLPAALDALAPATDDVPGGRMVVLAYHSLEDRLVKQAFLERTQDRAPRDLPVVPAELRASMRLLTRGAEKPGTEEIETNPRAASARLRAVERVEAA